MVSSVSEMLIVWFGLCYTAWSSKSGHKKTPLPQSTTPGLHPVSIHQMAPPEQISNCSLPLIYRPQKDERLSWFSWLTCSGRFTHVTGHSLDAGRMQDRENSLATDRHSTTVSCHQLNKSFIICEFVFNFSNV